MRMSGGGNMWRGSSDACFRIKSLQEKGKGRNWSASPALKLSRE